MTIQERLEKVETIPLTRGFEARVDAADFTILSKHKWQVVSHSGNLKNPSARRCVWDPVAKKQRAVFMHREIVGANNEQFVDHIDGNRLNNCRSNLRVCSSSENNQNKGLNSRNRSGFKGVSWIKKYQYWQASITARGTKTHLGTFRSAREAAIAYDKAAKKLHGAFARLNFKDDAEVLKAYEGKK